MRIKITFYSAVWAAALMLANCSAKKEDAQHDHSASENTEPASDAAAEPQFKADPAFQKQLAEVFTSYVSLKDALVSSDASKVKVQAAGVDKALQKVDMKLLTGAAHHDWMNYLSPMQTAIKEIQSGEGLDTQRKSFSTLSDNLYKAIKAFGLGGTEAFYEFCPMAFNNEGAYWLSDQQQIRNPYFGDEMLTCGSVIEKLK